MQRSDIKFEHSVTLSFEETINSFYRDQHCIVICKSFQVNYLTFVC